MKTSKLVIGLAGLVALLLVVVFGLLYLTLRGPLDRAKSEASVAATAPTGGPTFDPFVHGELHKAIRALRQQAAVQSAQYSVTLEQSSDEQETDTHRFVSTFSVTMRAGTSAAQDAEVPVTMATNINWSGVTLEQKTAKTSAQAAMEIDYRQSFDHGVPQDTALKVATGVHQVASVPSVESVTASIPWTANIDASSLAVTTTGDDPATETAARAAIAGTAFAAVGGSFEAAPATP